MIRILKFNFKLIRLTLEMSNKKAFQKDAYCSLANCTYPDSQHYQYWCGGKVVGTEVNKFEEVSCNDHQMSVAGGRCHV